MLNDGQLYLYSAIAQISGALIGLAAVGFTVGSAKMQGMPRRAKHAYRALRAASGLFLVVILASSAILFDEGRAEGLRFSRWILSVSMFFFVGGVTHHYWTGPRDGVDEVGYKKWQSRGWIATLSATGLSVIYGAIWLPRSAAGSQVGPHDLALVLGGLTGGLVLAFISIVQFIQMER